MSRTIQDHESTFVRHCGLLHCHVFLHWEETIKENFQSSKHNRFLNADFAPFELVLGDDIFACIFSIHTPESGEDVYVAVHSDMWRCGSPPRDHDVLFV